MSKIDVSKIEGYENMSAEEKFKALESFEFEEKPHDEKKWKDLVDKASAEASQYKKELRALQTEEQRKEAERKEAEEKRNAQLQELLKEKTIAEYNANLLINGYSAELANESATALADGDFTKFFENLNSFIGYKEKAIREELLKGTPTPKTGTRKEEILTKEQFDKMTFAERNKLFSENKDLYEQLTGKGE